MKDEEMPRWTPWGEAIEVTEIADGVVRVSAASHGGIWLSERRRVTMPAPLGDVQTYAGSNWYEEDEDACLVILAFAELFPPLSVWSAVKWAMHRGIRGERTSRALRIFLGPALFGGKGPALPAVKIAERFESEHGSEFLIGCEEYGGADGVVISGSSIDGSTRFVARRPTGDYHRFWSMPISREQIRDAFQSVWFGPREK